MATEVSRTFDPTQAKVVVHVKDDVLGNVSAHTAYLAGAHAVTDVNAWVQQVLAEVDTQAAAVKAKLVAAGWAPNGS